MCVPLLSAPSNNPIRRFPYDVALAAKEWTERDAWRARLTEAGVQTGVHYPIPVHLQPAYRDLGYSRGDFPVSERAAAEVLSLPIFPELTTEQIDTVASLFRAGVAAGARA